MTQIQSAPVRKQRLPEIDLIKCIAIIGMIFVHTFEVYSLGMEEINQTAPQNVIAGLIEFFGCAPSAPVFMFCMGLGIALSSRVTPRSLLKRAGEMALLGVLVNVGEFIVPMFWDHPSLQELEMNRPALLATDAYFFFMLAFLFYALALALKQPLAFSIAVCVFSLCSGAIFPTLDLEAGSSRALIRGLFVRSGDYSFFPFVTWIFFPAAGWLFGWLFSRSQDRVRFYRRSALAGAVLLAASSLLISAAGDKFLMVVPLKYEVELYYSMSALNRIWALGFILFWIALAFVVTNLTSDGCLRKGIGWCSRNLMAIYVSQWFMIGILLPVIEFRPEAAWSLVSGTLVTACAFGTTQLWLRVKPKLRRA